MLGIYLLTDFLDLVALDAHLRLDLLPRDDSSLSLTACSVLYTPTSDFFDNLDFCLLGLDFYIMPGLIICHG